MTRRSPAVVPAVVIVLLALAFSSSPLILVGQSTEIRREIIESQRRLEEVRQERVRLRREMADLGGQVRDVSAELANVERQISASRSALGEVDFQADAVAAEIQTMSRTLVLTREPAAGRGRSRRRAGSAP